MSFKRVPKKVWLIGSIVLLLFIGGVIAAREFYDANLGAYSSNPKTVILSVPSGATVNQIGQLLKSHGIIRSSWVFDWYVHSVGASNHLEAGDFALSPSDTMSQVVSIISSGHVAEGTVTIVPGRTIAQIEDTLINDGFTPSAVSSALNPANYSGLPIIADLPSGVTTLEGLLYPDTFDKTSSTKPSQIITESLSEMSDHITQSLKDQFSSEGLSVYQAITLASIIQQEVSKPGDMAQVAQVFLSRLNQGLALGSDVTANYGAVLAGLSPSLSYDSPYNTLIHTGLPPTPIGTIGQNSLNAVASPASTNWLYFVTGDNGITYFETTVAQHNADTANYCHKLCQVP
ncbi:MAG: endolytic transglycosylase MltG [Candidatus Saccharimonadales bacterium]